MKTMYSILFFLTLSLILFIGCKKETTEPENLVPEFKNVQEISLPQNTNFIGDIIWQHSNQGFYFTAGDGSISMNLYYCNRSDYSIKTLPLKMDHLRLVDITKDDQSLLLIDNNGTASNIYLFDIQNNNKTLLVPAQTNLIITSCKYSQNDSKIVFSTDKFESNMTVDYFVFLFTQNDKKLTKIENISKYSTILGWVPNSNDKFYFHSSIGSISTYSLAENNSTMIKLSENCYNFKVLSLGNLVLAANVTRQDKNTITESHMVMFNMSGQFIQELTNNSDVIYEYAASPDSKTLIFTGSQGNQWHMRICAL